MLPKAALDPGKIAVYSRLNELMWAKGGSVRDRHTIAVDSITSVLRGKVGRNDLCAVGVRRGSESRCMC